MKFFLFLLISFIFYGCASSKPSVNKLQTRDDIYDLKSIPQDIRYFTSSLKDTKKLYKIQKEYKKSYFSIWNDFRFPPLEVNMWAFKSYKFGNTYGENLNLLEKKFFFSMLKNANFKDYKSVNKYAMTLKNLDIRAFPTSKVVLKNPSLAGEGFPFDYMQNSTIYINKPLLVSHYSKDRAWVYIFSSFTSGWVRADSIVYLDAEDIKNLQQKNYISIVKDSFPVYDKHNKFLFYTKIGMRFPLVSENKKSYEVIVVSLDAGTKRIFKIISIPKEISTRKTLLLNKKNLNIVIGSIFKTKYGWGGLFGDRDCSSTIRDLFTPFGIWLPRNSSKQAKIGKIITLDGLSDDEKISIIEKKAIPFQTLLYKKGHILLYVGSFKNQIVVFHNTWGIKTKKNGVEGRLVIGKTIFSTLEIGKYLKYYDEDAKLIKHIKSINILTK